MLIESKSHLILIGLLSSMHIICVLLLGSCLIGHMRINLRLMLNILIVHLLEMSLLSSGSLGFEVTNF